MNEREFNSLTHLIHTESAFCSKFQQFMLVSRLFMEKMTMKEEEEEEEWKFYDKKLSLFPHRKPHSYYKPRESMVKLTFLLTSEINVHLLL